MCIDHLWLIQNGVLFSETGPDLIREGEQKIGTGVERKHSQKRANGTGIQQKFMAKFHDFTLLAPQRCG